MKRGIISTPGKFVAEGNSVNVSSLSPNDLKFMCLYWDEIVIPVSFAISAGYPYRDDLINCGIVKEISCDRSNVVNSRSFVQNTLTTQAEFYKLMEKHQTMNWSIHQTGTKVVDPEIDWPHANLVDRVETRIALNNTLPIPAGDVNLNEILEFKSRRSDDLTALHSYIDELSLEILASPDKPLSQLTAIERMKQEIENQLRAQNEVFNGLFNMDLSLSHISAISLAGYHGFREGYDFAQSFGIPEYSALTSTTGAVIGALTCEHALTKLDERLKSDKQLTYVSKAASERVITNY